VVARVDSQQSRFVGGIVAAKPSRGVGFAAISRRAVVVRRTHAARQHFVAILPAAPRFATFAPYSEHFAAIPRGPRRVLRNTPSTLPTQPKLAGGTNSMAPAPAAQGARAARRRPECIELVAPRRLPDRRARPPRPGAGGRVSGAPRRAMGWYRRDADLGPRRDRSRPAPSGVTTEWPAVRVEARGGGGRRAGIPLRSLCLAQRRERRGRVHSLAHQLAERALPRAACGRRGEHVFGRLRRRSDGMRTLRGSVCGSGRIWP
jgi:hypothetical protein